MRKTDIGALWIDGGPSVPLDPKKPPTDSTAEGPVIPFLCQDLSAIVASLTEVPNEPVRVFKSIRGFFFAVTASRARRPTSLAIGRQINGALKMALSRTVCMRF